MDRAYPEPSGDGLPAEESASKRARLNEEEEEEEEDPRAKAMLAMSRYCQEQWVRNMVMLHMSRGQRLKLALLSGDAGCGKSYAISLLEKKLRNMDISVVVSAMTNKAAGALMESGGLDRVYTFHKMMGFKKELLDDKLSREGFTRLYGNAYREAIARYKELRVPGPPCERDETSDARHACRELRAESCAACSKRFERLRAPAKPGDQGHFADAPPFLGANVLIVDEYGLLNVELLERMLLCLGLFYGPDKGPLIVFSGSVSQLQPAGSHQRVWETERFAGLLSSATPLLVNRRQFRDPGYAEALTYLQFNTITEESQRIFASLASVRERDAMDPSYEPQMLRIFHQDEQQKAYTAAYMSEATKTARAGEKFLRVARTSWSHAGPRAWYEVLKQAVQSLPKLFSVPKWREGARAQEREYLTVDKLWVGCRVRLIWHMDYNGIQVSEGSWPSSAPGAGARRRASSATDTEGVVRGVRYDRKAAFNVFFVEGSQTGTVYRVAPSTWNYLDWTVTTHPLACLLAMNTYDCQGCTVHGQVLYHPPRNFAMSPIKPSVYVALSRVVSREKMHMTNCNFADRIGTVRFYDDRLLAYRKRVEMSYAS